MLEVFDENHLSEMIKDSVTQLCKNVFHYNLELTVDGLLGVTLDKSSVMLISIKENVQVATLNQDLQLNSQDMATDSGTAVTGEYSRLPLVKCYILCYRNLRRWMNNFHTVFILQVTKDVS